MNNNFTSQDLVKVRTLLKKKNIILTQSTEVENFEKKWSKLKIKSGFILLIIFLVFEKLFKSIL